MRFNNKDYSVTLEPKDLAKKRGKEVLAIFGWKKMPGNGRPKELVIYADGSATTREHNEPSHMIVIGSDDESTLASLQRPNPVLVFAYFKGKLPRLIEDRGDSYRDLDMKAFTEDKDGDTHILAPLSLDAWIDGCTSFLNMIRPIDICYQAEKHVAKKETLRELRARILCGDVDKAKEAAMTLRKELSSNRQECLMSFVCRRSDFLRENVLKKAQVSGQFGVFTKKVSTDKVVITLKWKGPTASRLLNPGSITKALSEAGRIFKDSIENKAKGLALRCTATVDVRTSGAFDIDKVVFEKVREVMLKVAKKETFPEEWIITMVLGDVERIENQHARPPPPQARSFGDMMALMVSQGR